jgi:hypothetical protein
MGDLECEIGGGREKRSDIKVARGSRGSGGQFAMTTVRFSDIPAYLIPSIS